MSATTDNQRRAPAAPPIGWAVLAGTVLLGAYTVASIAFPPGNFLTAFGDITQVVAALFAVLSLSVGIKTGSRRTRLFWTLMALGCFLWGAGQASWIYFEVALHQPVPDPFLGDVVLFLHAVPMLAALALRPHDSRAGLNMRLGYLDFGLLGFWWVFLYAFIVIPWQYVSPDVLRYGFSYGYLEGVENLLVALGFGALALQAHGPWRRTYAHLFGAALLWVVGAYTTNVAIDVGKYYSGSPYDVPLVAAFVWFGITGARGASPAVDHRLPWRDPEATTWSSRVATVAAFSLPLMGLLNQLLLINAPPRVRNFRAVLTSAAILIVGLFIFLRHRMVDNDRLRLVHASQGALEDLQLLQSQMIQTEKLASLGQLAAGAAHEINNPLTGIIGYADLLTDDPALGAKSQALVLKIRSLAHRIKTLVSSLLSFSRQTTTRKQMLDLNGVLASAIHLNNLDLRGKNIQLEIHTDPQLPTVHADANQMLQVFFNIMNNAVDALEEAGGGKLIISTLSRDSKVFVEFADSGPGVAAPHLVFDPFFTTKPANKGTGLGLSICYGILQEHGGNIECHNRPEGGASFVVELPAAADANVERGAAAEQSATTR